MVYSRGIIFAMFFILMPGVQSQDFDRIEIQIEKVSDTVYVLFGSGGNIGLSVGNDGTFMIDDQYAPLTEKIVAAIAGITGHPVDFIINTHYHFDHTDGNENFAGRGAVIVSHENSRYRMSTDQLIELFNYNQEAYPDVALPKITFDDSVRFHLNGETIDVFHLGPAHTDGDAIVYFRDSNVVHTGDVFVRYGLPFIDQPNGGSINGLISVVTEILERTNDDTVFIPGHGAVSQRSHVSEYLDMLIDIRDQVRNMIQQGRSFQEIVQANPADGYPTGSVSAENFLRLVYDSLSENQ